MSIKTNFCPDCGKLNLGIHTCSPQYALIKQQEIENKVQSLLYDLAVYKADSKRYQLLKSGVAYIYNPNEAYSDRCLGFVNSQERFDLDEDDLDTLDAYLDLYLDKT